jgi:hypothetical protein
VAWQTAHLMNVAGKIVKERVTPDDLVGKVKRRPLPEGNVDSPRVPDEELGLQYVALLNAAMGGTDTRG